MIRSNGRSGRRLRAALMGTLAFGLLAGLALPRQAAFAEEAPRRVPEATVRAEEAPGLRTATLAGGCFWGVQGVFQHVKGVRQAVSGYAGGAKETARYEKVGTGRTGHAESVQVTYDPAVIRYDQLLQVYFSVALDPTQVDGQGPDEGTQYRSAIFPADAEQARVAKAYIAQLDAAKTYGEPIATKVEPGAQFYPAEGYHQDFMALNPSYPYIVVNDAPKLKALQTYFPERSNAAPVLVGRPKA